MVLKKYYRIFWSGFTWPSVGKGAGPLGHGTERSGCIGHWEFVYLGKLWRIKEYLCRAVINEAYIVELSITVRINLLRVKHGLYGSCVYVYKYKGKRKVTPLQAWTGPEDSRRLRFPHFKTIGTWMWQGCQPYAPTTFTPRKYSWYYFLLQAEQTPKPYCGRKDYVNDKFQWHHRESNPRPSACSAVPKPIAPPHAPNLKGYNLLKSYIQNFICNV
jgi:hypothetical protein